MHAPARLCRDRMGEPFPCARGRATAPDDEGGHAALLRSQLQAPALGKVERSQFAHQGSKARHAQRFLKRPQRVLVPPGGKMNEARRIAAARGQGAGIKIALPRHPQHMAGTRFLRAARKTRGDAGGKACLLEIGPGNFMEGAGLEPATRQMPVYGLDAPGDGRLFPSFRRKTPLQQPDPPPQGSKVGRGQIGSLGGGGYRVRLFHIPFLFSLRGESSNENIKRTFW